MHSHCCIIITNHPPPGPFLSRKTAVLYPSNIPPVCPPPHPLGVPLPLSVSVNLTPLGTSAKWTRTVFVFLWLAYCTEHENVLEVYPGCSMCQNFLLFLRVNNVPLYGCSTFIYALTCGWTVGLLRPFGCREWCCHEYQYMVSSFEWGRALAFLKPLVLTRSSFFWPC